MTAGKQQQQQNAKNALKILFDALLFLARQGLPIRGKTDKKSNYVNLLNILAAYNNDLSKFLNRRKAYTSHDIQNEMLELCANSIIRIISVKARTSGPFGIIVDGCQDGDSEQISICIRYVTDDLRILEEPIGFYSTPKSDAATFIGIIVDVLLRVNLDIKLIIGQSYDGASTMSGQHGGVQALIQEKAPMAAYVHCYAHRLDLVLQEAGREVPMIRDAMNLVHDISAYLNASALRRAKFKAIQNDLIQQKRICIDDVIDTESIANNVDFDQSDENWPNERNVNKKPIGFRKLYLTRWVTRTPALQDAITGYDTLQVAFHSLGQEYGTKQSVPMGIATMLNKGTTYLGIYISLKIFSQAEFAYRMLQQRNLLLNDAREVVDKLRIFYEELRTDEQWGKMWISVMKTVEEFDLDKPELTRIRRPPKKLESAMGNIYSQPHTFPDVSSKYKMEYFGLLDLLINQLKRRFVPQVVNAMTFVERLLIGSYSEDDLNIVIDFYGLFFKSMPSLVRHLENLSNLCGMKRDLAVVIDKMKSASHNNTSSVYREVILLIKIYCASLVSSVECKRSFSVMRRLMRWLQKTTGQQRLNHEFTLLAHAQRQIDMNNVLADFVKLNISRQEDFGIQHHKQ